LLFPLVLILNPEKETTLVVSVLRASPDYRMESKLKYIPRGLSLTLFVMIWCIFAGLPNFCEAVEVLAVAIPFPVMISP
jgi:hypothetical protein